MATKENYTEALLVETASIPLETVPKGTVKKLRRQLKESQAEVERLRKRLAGYELPDEEDVPWYGDGLGSF